MSILFRDHLVRHIIRIKHLSWPAIRLCIAANPARKVNLSSQILYADKWLALSQDNLSRDDELTGLGFER